MTAGTAGSGDRCAGPGDRSAGCSVLHVDMDAFFASVVLRGHPELRGAPVVVGGRGRGVVLSATYPARRRGVRSGMPVARALRLCPDAVVLPPDHGAFAEVSRQVVGVFGRHTPRVEVLSLDEAFLDVSGLRRHATPLEVAHAVRAEVAAVAGITCSVGIAPTPTVAKMATSRAKPDGVHIVPVGEVLDFLHPLPVEAVHGVGPATVARLHRLELRTVGDVARMPLAALRAGVGAHAGAYVHAIALGRDPRAVRPGRSVLHPERSMSAEETFARDTADRAVLERELLRLATGLGVRLRRRDLVATRLTVKVRLSDRTTTDRARTLAGPTASTRELVEHARVLLDLQLEQHRGRRVRLLGVALAGLVPAERVGRQLRLGEPDLGWTEAEVAADAVVARFGTSSVRPASLLHRRP